MRSTDRPETDEVYEEDYEDPTDDNRGFRAYFPTGLWPGMYSPDVDEDTYDGTVDEDTYDDTAREGDGTWLDEGLITLLLVAGIVLFLFPEPATSGLGILLLLAGGTLWLVDWVT